jgi:transcriptional regulator with XRE-family HTH domain
MAIKPPIGFPSAFKAIRKKKKLSVRKAAKELGLSPSTIQRYEAGTSEPGLETLISIADRMGVSLNSLTGRKNGRKVA